LQHIGSMIHGLCPTLDAQLQIFVLRRFHFELGGEVILVVMLEPQGVAQLHNPKWYGGVATVILLH